MQARFASRFVGALSISILLLPVPATTQPTTPPPAPPLPVLDLDAFAAASRDDLAGAYRRAEAAPDDPTAVGALAMALHAWEQYEAAARAYARAQRLAPAVVDWWYLGGSLAARRGLHDDAARQYRRALDLAPEDGLVALRYADAALEAGDGTAAAVVYTPLTSRPETAPAAWYGLGRVRQDQGDAAGAREAYERAVALYPAFGAAHYALAQLQRQAGARDAARVSLRHQQECLACWPMPADPWSERLAAVRSDAAALLSRGVATAAGGTATAAAEAIRLHEAAVTQDPDLGQAHVNLVELYARTGNMPRAEAHYRAAAALPGYAAEAHRAWGGALLQQRRVDEALPALRDAVALAPTNAQALNALGLALELSRQPAEAAGLYARATAAAPTARDIRFNLARALVQLGRLDEAITELERLRQPEDAETPRYLFALSVAYVRNGNREAGLRIGEQAAALATQFGQADLAQSIARDLAALQGGVPR